MEYTGNISESLKPTYKNVTTEFIKNTLYTTLCNKSKTNFRMRFEEAEAQQFIIETLQETAKGGKYWERKAQEVLKGLKRSEELGDDSPVMVIRDYKAFFQALTELCEENVHQHFKRTNNFTFPWYERVNCLEEVWLRMAPEDFTDPENFLRVQVQMAKDTTFRRQNKK